MNDRNKSNVHTSELGQTLSMLDLVPVCADVSQLLLEDCFGSSRDTTAATFRPRRHSFHSAVAAHCNMTFTCAQSLSVGLVSEPQPHGKAKRHSERHRKHEPRESLGVRVGMPSLLTAWRTHDKLCKTSSEPCSLVQRLACSPWYVSRCSVAPGRCRTRSRRWQTVCK